MRAVLVTGASGFIGGVLCRRLRDRGVRVRALLRTPAVEGPWDEVVDDRIAGLISIVGLALLVFGIIEAGVRRGLGPGQPLPGILPEGRAALPTGRSILAAFQGLGLTYTDTGPLLDRLTTTQRRILTLLDAAIPWPEGDSLPSPNCGKRA
jgi:hypothetical protein